MSHVSNTVALSLTAKMQSAEKYGTVPLLGRIYTRIFITTANEVRYTLPLEVSHEAIDTGIDILHRAVAVEAIHDSAESFPQPRCHPETRMKMLEDLYRWAVHPHSQSTVLWLYSPACAGKSAIMQTLASRLQDAGRLGGSFVFKRGHAMRGNAKMLFATIAYQLALAIVENDPSVVVRTIATQIKRLIFDPCHPHENCDPVTILIDGLDECEGHEVQVEILDTIQHRSKHPIPFRFIVASRPEAHICEVFNSPVYVDNYRSFNVEQSFEDVRRYLHDQFTRIHCEHRTMSHIPLPWPSPDILKDMVNKSSGYFVYAATMIKFIDDKSHRPTRQLAIIIHGSQGSESPFDTLDQLYRTILSSRPGQAELVPILCAITNFRLDLEDVDALFDLEDGEARLILRGLHSVLRVPEIGPTISVLRIWTIRWQSLGLSSDFVQVEDISHAGTSGSQGMSNLVGNVVYLTCSKSSPENHLIPFLISLPPSPELCPLFASMDPDFIFTLRYDQFGDMLSWLKKIPSVPQDLIELWEDHVFMSLMAGYRTTCVVKHILSPTSELCQVLAATVFLGFSLGIRRVPHLLDMTWTEFRIILCSVRSNIASDPEPVLHGSPLDAVHALVPPEMQQGQRILVAREGAQTLHSL
ncbi:hypothetical protein C8R45DRAFT_1106912 [Mycena sanguinolenta]|nr:hypothetical protein C8R45DRAFT_1106912 [Mycena sanguinolenta]